MCPQSLLRKVPRLFRTRGRVTQNHLPAIRVVGRYFRYDDTRPTFRCQSAFFGQVTKLDARRARLTLIQANARYRLATVSVRYGVREFRVEIDRYRNTIRFSEITVHRRLEFDRRNPLNGFAMQEIEYVRLLHTHRSDRYLPVESDLDKN